jgi:TRAP-type mannitol/chloroaromatic compound transport system permease small subunit
MDPVVNAPDELIADRRLGDPGDLPEDMPPWMARTIAGIDTFSRFVGRLVSFLVIPIFCVMVYEIVMRYAFIAPTMWAYDISRMFYGALFMLGAGYGLSRGVHIRADFLYRNFSVSMQGRVDLTLYLLFYFPGLLVFLWTSIDFAWGSLSSAERGMDTAWMPYLGPIKAVLPVGIVLLLLQGISEVLKCWYAATRGRWPQ